VLRRIYRCKGEEVTEDLGKFPYEHHTVLGLPDIKVTQGG